MTQCHIGYKILQKCIWHVVDNKHLKIDALWNSLFYTYSSLTILVISCCITNHCIIVFHFLVPWLTSDVWFSVGFLMCEWGPRDVWILAWVGCLRMRTPWLAVGAACWLGAQLRLAARVSTISLSIWFELLIAWCLDYERGHPNSKHCRRPS